MRWIRVALLLLVLYSTAAVVDVQSQCYTGDCDSLLQAMTTDSGYAVRVMLPDSTMSPEMMNVDDYCAGIRYEYATDSSHVYWAFSEFLLNKHKLFLSNWCPNRVMNFDTATHLPTPTWSATELNNRSTTRTIAVSSADTLQFFREQWLGKQGSAASAYNFFKSDHELSYSVELVDSATGVRVLLLDTTRYATTTASRKPCFYMWYPMFSRVRTVIPPGIDNVRAFVRINTFVLGSNPDPWVRVDNYRPFLSHKFLSKPSIVAYNSNIQNNQDCSPPTCAVQGNGYSSPSRITINCAVPSTLTSVALYTPYGVELWQGTVPLSSNPITVNVAQPGGYIVVARDSTGTVCTDLVFVP